MNDDKGLVERVDAVAVAEAAIEACGIQVLSDRIAVLTKLVVAMDDHVDDCCGCFGTAEPEMLAAMNECRSSLTPQESSSNAE